MVSQRNSEPVGNILGNNTNPSLIKKAELKWVGNNEIPIGISSYSHTNYLLPCVLSMHKRLQIRLVMKSEFREILVPYIFPEGSKQRLLCKF